MKFLFRNIKQTTNNLCDDGFMEIIIQIVLAVMSAIATSVIGYFFYKFKKYEKISKTENEKQIKEILSRVDAVVGALRALCSERILQIYVENKKRNSITKQKNGYCRQFVSRLP